MADKSVTDDQRKSFGLPRRCKIDNTDGSRNFNGVIARLRDLIIARRLFPSNTFIFGIARHSSRSQSVPRNTGNDEIRLDNR
jgi:hypothetical protein